jgi:4-amino-4-deoxy-L-arabinose transferase-like glycosyltransferase
MPRRLQTEYLLLCLYWFTRLHALAALPGFFDEAVHIRWAKLAWAGQPFHAASDGRLLNIWAYAALFPFGEALWIARAATLLAGAAGFAALLALGRRLFGQRAAWLGGLLYTGLPYAFFYERMALADSFSAPLVTLALLASVQALSPGRRRSGSALLAGALLAALALTKLTNLLFLAIPALVWLAGGSAAARRVELRRLGASYGVALVLIAAAAVALRTLANSDLGLDLIAARTNPALLAERLANNARTLYGYRGYLTPGVALLGLLALPLSRQRRAAALLAAVVGLPVAALLGGSNVAESRFLAPVLPLAALLSGAAASRLVGWVARPWQRLAGLALAVLTLASAAGFFRLAWTAPGALPLTDWDRYQYVEEWPAGFGLRETAQQIFGPGAERPLDVVVSDEGHIPQLSLYAPWEPGLYSLYAFEAGGARLLHLPPEFHNPFGGLADPARAALYVVETPRFQAQRDALAARLTLLARFPRPGGKTVIEVYRIEPIRNP